MSMPLLLDAAGRRRSPATVPGYLAGRPPRNKGLTYPADPPPVEEIVAVMREAGSGVHGARVRGLIVVLWRAGLRIREALSLAEVDLDEYRGALLVRNGKGGKRREVGMDQWGFERCVRGLATAHACRLARSSASSTAPPTGGHGQPTLPARSCGDSPPKPASGGASRPTSCATRTPSSSPTRACRSTSSNASSATPISVSPRSTCKASTTPRSSPPSTRDARR
jgi:hypothetical protein